MSTGVVRLILKNLGDQWAAVTGMLFRSELTGEPIRLERTGVELGDQTWEAESMVRRIAALLDSTGTIEYTDETGDDCEPPSDRWRYSLPTRVRWTPGRHVCLQLTGSWMAAEKNCDPAEAAILRDGLRALGYELIELGLPMPLEEGVEKLATCRFFIGIDSGYMHVAHSVGCPRFLIRNRMPGIDAIHGGRNWIGCANALECLESIRNNRLPFPGM